MNPQVVSHLLLSTVARSLVLLACAEVVLWTFRRRNASAAQRHLVLLTGLTLLLALPLLTAILPARTVAAKIQGAFAAPVSEAAIAWLNVTDKNTSNTLHFPDLEREPVPAHMGGAPEAPNSIWLPDLKRPRVSGRSTLRIVDSTPLSGLRSYFGAAARSMVPAVFGIYLLGAALASLRFGLSYLRLDRIARSSYLDVADSGWQQRVRRLAESQGGSRELRVRYAINSGSTPFATPVTFGFVSPTLLIPAETIAGEWPTTCTDAVLRHEIAHVQRYDWLAQLLVNAACALYWFNPWVWSQARRLSADAEAACDDQALRAGVEPTEYAEHLLFVAQSVSRRTGNPVGWVARWQPDTALGMAQSGVEERLTSVLARQRNRSTVGARTLIAVIAFALLVVAPAAATRRTVRVPAAPEDRNRTAVALMRRVQAATLRLNSLNADFTYNDTNHQRQQYITGDVRMMRPNFARVHFGSMNLPAFPNLVASDGKSIYTFTPSSFRGPYHFNDELSDIRRAGQASGTFAGGGKISTTPAKPNGENVHLWDAAPVQAFLDPIRAVQDWVYVTDLRELRYEGRVVINGTSYQVLEHHMMGETRGESVPFEQRLYIGPDNLIHGYLLEYRYEGRQEAQIAWLSHIRTNVSMQPSDFAFTPPTAEK